MDPDPENSIWYRYVQHSEYSFIILSTTSDIISLPETAAWGYVSAERVLSRSQLSYTGNFQPRTQILCYATGQNRTRLLSA